MSEKMPRSSWDHHIGLVLALLGGFILLVKFKVHTLVLSLWPLALIFLGWQMYRKAGGGSEEGWRRRGDAASERDLDEAGLDEDDEFDDDDAPCDDEADARR